MNEDKIKAFCDILTSSFESFALINITFSNFPKGELLKVKGTPKTVSGNRLIQFEYSLTEGRVKHENIASDGFEGFISVMISLGARSGQITAQNGTAALLVSSKGAINVTKKMGKPLKTLFPVAQENNNVKQYIFKGEEAFLIELGISDRQGRVHDKKQPKFRQINRFAEQVRDVMKYLPSDGTLKIYDLCCGKSYLSFAVYAYLTEHLNREVEMICADLKKSVIEYCSEVSAKLGYDGMRFICSDISEIKTKDEPDLVISLHACDTATDIVLDFAIRNRAKVILSTPCCQHEMFRIMDCPELGFISDYSILKQKIASAATDALRLAKLEANGYRTDAIEFIDPDETPKNVLLRGIRKHNFSYDSKLARDKLEKYEEAYKFMTGKAAEIERD